MRVGYGEEEEEGGRGRGGWRDRCDEVGRKGRREGGMEGLSKRG